MTSRRFTLDTGTEVIRTVIRVTIMDEHLTHRFLISSPNKHSASKATQKKCQLYDKKKKKPIFILIFKLHLENLKWTMLSSQQNKTDCGLE